MTDYGLLKAPENMTPQAQELLDRYMQRQKDIDREHNKEMAKLYGGAALQIGSALIPGTLGLKVGSSAIKALTPYMGKKIAENVATGTISGLASGAVEGLGRGLLERENPLKTMLSDSALSALGGGAVGYMGGQLLKNLAKKGLQGNKQAQTQYWDDYIEGLSDNARLGEQSLQSKEVAKFRALRDWGSDKGISDVSQFDIIADENGKPIKFYHGSPNAGFLKFKPLSHFSKDLDYASIYKNPSASSLQVKQTANNPGVYEVNLDVNKMFDTRNPNDKNIFLNEYQAYYSPELTKKGLPDWMEAEDLAEWLQSKYPEYDALIVDEGGTGGYGDIVKDRGESYIPFNSNQIKINKLITDKGEKIFNNPNNNPDSLYKKLTDNSLKYRDEWVKIDGKDYRVLNLPKKDYGKILHILDTDLSKEIPIGDVLEKSDANYLYKFQKTSPTDYKFIGRKKLK